MDVPPVSGWSTCTTTAQPLHSNGLEYQTFCDLECLEKNIFYDKVLVVVADIHTPHGNSYVYDMIRWLQIDERQYDKLVMQQSNTQTNDYSTTAQSTIHPSPTSQPAHDQTRGGQSGDGMSSSFHTTYGASAMATGGVGAFIVAGDVFDFASLSPYTATAERVLTVDEELVHAGEVLHELRKRAPVYVLAGNHDDRFVKRLGTHFSYRHVIQAALSYYPAEDVYPVIVTDRDYLFVGDELCVAHLSMARGHAAAMRMAARAALRLRRHVLFGHTHRQGAQREEYSSYWGIGIGSCVGDMWYGQKYLRDTILYGRDGAFTQRGFAVYRAAPEGCGVIVVYDGEGRPVFVKDGDMVSARDTFIGKRVMVWE